jgi:hypothetical protein
MLLARFMVPQRVLPRARKAAPEVIANAPINAISGMVLAVLGSSFAGGGAGCAWAISTGGCGAGWAGVMF